MNSAKLSTKDKKRLAQKTSVSGFNLAVECMFSEIGMENHEYILNELSLRHTAWTGLINTEINTAVVIETGLGAVVSALSKVVEHVYALYLDDDTKNIVESRLRQNNKINHYVIGDFPENISFNPDKTLLVSYIEDKNEIVKSNFNSILLSYDINYYYCINKPEFTSVIGTSKTLVKPDVYHIEGTARDPFRLTSRSNKIHQFGYVKYFIFNLYVRVSGKYVTETNLEINKSFFIFVANIFFENKNYFLRDIFFIKPNGVLLLIEVSGNRYMLRITSDPLGKKRLNINNQALKLLEKNNIDFSPLLSGEKEINNYRCSVEECIKGRNITVNDIKDSFKKETFYKQANKKLIDFQISTLTSGVINEDLYKRLIFTPILKSRSYFSDKYHHVFDMLEVYFKKSLINKSLPLVLYHGDFSADNLMIHNGNISGIIDWEYSIQNCLPLIDLIFLFCNVFKKINNVSIIKAMQEVVILNNIGNLEVNEINSYCEHIGINKDIIKPLSLMCVVYFIAYRLESNSEISRVSIFDKHFSVLLDSIEKLLSSYNK